MQSTPDISGQFSRVLDVLGRDDLPAEGVRVLKTYLDQPEPESTQPADFVLRKYARLMPGAEYIRREQYGKARNLLSRARLDSPAGVETALSAHSRQLHGNRDQALSGIGACPRGYRVSPRVLQTVLDRLMKRPMPVIISSPPGCTNASWPRPWPMSGNWPG